MLPNQTISAILSSLRTFEPLSDTLDIIIISFVFYQLLQFARKSRAGQLVKGILIMQDISVDLFDFLMDYCK